MLFTVWLKYQAAEQLTIKEYIDPFREEGKK